MLCGVCALGRCLPLIVLLAAIPTTSQAQWIVSAYAAAIHTGSRDLRIDQPAHNTHLVFANMQFESRSWGSPIYYGYRVGHNVPGFNWLFVEAELIHGKLYPARPADSFGSGSLRGASVSDVVFESVIQEFNISHRLNFVLANVLVRRTTSMQRLTATGRFSAGPLVPHPESVVNGRRYEGYELAGLSIQLSGGVEVRVLGPLAVTADYKWTGARPRGSLAEGTATVTTHSHHVEVGVSAAF